MSGHTIINLKQLEGSEAARAAGIDARFGRSHLGSEHLGVTYFHFGPGVRPATGHSHREQEEAYVVTAGSGQVRLDDEVHDLSQWDVVRVSPNVVRGFRAGPDGLELIAIGSDRPEGGDGATVKDWWTD
jgi:quercetin dioxygenase-like cupin family protein